jgi:hypothetical protein
MKGCENFDSGSDSAGRSTPLFSNIAITFRSNLACGSPHRSIVQLWSLCFLQSRDLDVPGPVGGSEWGWGVEVCTPEEDDIHRNVVGGQLYDPAEFW